MKNFIVSILVFLLLGAGDESHQELTFKSYLPVFLIQTAGFAILAYVVVRFAFPYIKNAVKERKQKTEEYICSLDEKIVSDNKKLIHLQEQLNNIEKIIEERKKARERDIQRISETVEKEIEEIHRRILERLKLEEELEILKLRIFVRDFARGRIYEYVKRSLTDKQLQNVQQLYEREFLNKLTALKQQSDFISKLKMI